MGYVLLAVLLVAVFVVGYKRGRASFWPPPPNYPYVRSPRPKGLPTESSIQPPPPQPDSAAYKRGA